MFPVDVCWLDKPAISSSYFRSVHLSPGTTAFLGSNALSWPSPADLDAPILILFPEVLPGLRTTMFVPFNRIPPLVIEISFRRFLEVFTVSVSSLQGCSFQQLFRRFPMTFYSVSSSRVALLTSSADNAFGVAWLSMKITYYSASFADLLFSLFGDVRYTMYLDM